MPRHGKYPYELPERAVRLVLENESEYGSQWEAIVVGYVVLAFLGQATLGVGARHWDQWSEGCRLGHGDLQRRHAGRVRTRDSR